MIGDIDNLIQLLTTAICTSYAIFRATRYKGRRWILLGLFSGLFFIGTLYYQLFFMFYDDTPFYLSISDLCWYTSYLFLLLLLIYLNVNNRDEDLAKARERGEVVQADQSVLQWARNTSPVIWLVPVFTIAMFFVFIQRGDYIINFVVMLLMTGILWHAVYGLMFIQKNPKRKENQQMLFIVVLIFGLTEYALWVASLFWTGYTVTNIYFWFDFLLSFTFLLFIPAVARTVRE